MFESSFTLRFRHSLTASIALGTCMLSACSAPLDAQGLVINEVLATNTKGFTDSDGLPQDWIELHNPTANALSLSDCGLSDDPENPMKWRFPYLVVPPNGYVTVFASGQNKTDTDDPLHTNFKLKTSGEVLLLSDRAGTLLDQVGLTGSPANVSIGRNPLAPEEWVHFHTPSPNTPNPPDGWQNPRSHVDTRHPVLTEVLANNASTLLDEDGDSSDWIELANLGDKPIDLSGYHLSDKFEQPNQWTFPQRTLAPNERIIVYASNKNKTDSELHTNFKLKGGSDSVVLTAPTGEVLESVDLPKLPKDSALGRIPEPPHSWVVYARPTPTLPNASQGRALDTTVPPNPQRTVVISEVMALNKNVKKDDKRRYSDWVELHNRSETTINLKGYGFTDNSDEPFKYQFDEVVLAPNEMQLLWLSGESCAPPECRQIHLPFGLNPNGETLRLTAPNGLLIDSLHTGTLRANLSSGRTPDDSGARVYFANPTPGEANTQLGYPGYAEQPIIETPGGFYDGAVRVSLSPAPEGTLFRYTLDGEEPTKRSQRYSKPLRITQNSVLKVRAFSSTRLPSRVSTQTYLFDPIPSLPVVSLSVSPEDFFDPTTGLHEKGPNASEVFPHEGANYWKKTELPVHIELFETTGLASIDQDAGLRIFGAFSRGMAKKSLHIIARSKYGTDRFHYPLFPSKELDSVRSFVLRQSGQDAYKTRFRDALMTRLIADSGVDFQGHRPVILYINGQYWGLYNIREKVNQHFIADNHQLRPDDVNLLRANGAPDHGSNQTYHRMLGVFRAKDLRDDKVWAWAEGQMDIQNFVDYQFFQIYFANNDNGNIRFWRESGPAGQWRWILYDLDWGFADPTHRTLAHVSDPQGTGAGKAFSTTIWTQLKANPKFKTLFLQRAAFHLNNTFAPERVLRFIDAFEADIADEVERDRVRWSRKPGDWEAQVRIVRQFATKRPKYVVKELKRHFALSDEELESYGLNVKTEAP